MSRKRIYADQAEQKRAWRARQRQPRTGSVVTGEWLPLSSGNVAAAVIDALGQMIRAGDGAGHAAAVLDLACKRFGCPEVAALTVAKKLGRRQPKVLSARRSYPGQI